MESKVILAYLMEGNIICTSFIPESQAPTQMIYSNVKNLADAPTISI